MATSFLNGDYSRVLPIVSSFFTIKDFQRNIREDYVQFLIAESQIKDKFPSFLKELGKVGMVAAAKRSKYVSRLMPTLSSMRLSVDDGIVLTVVKMQKQKPRNKFMSSMPSMLFLATIAIVFADGFLRASFFGPFVRDPFMLAVVYTMSVMGIIGIHEFGHIMANRKYGIRASWPYFIPGIPGFIPTFGALIVLRSNMTNRNVMFDVGIAGPIAGLIITIIVSVYGSATSLLVPAAQVEELFGHNTLFPLNLNLVMFAILDLVGKEMVAGTVLVMSPVLFAAWLGFLITFLNLMPAWQLDGGHIARSALGVRWHKILTYVSVAILFALEFYPMAILILLFSMRAPENAPLDDVTPLSSKRKMLFFITLGLAVVIAPIPSSLFGLISFGS